MMMDGCKVEVVLTKGKKLYLVETFLWSLYKLYYATSIFMVNPGREGDGVLRKRGLGEEDQLQPHIHGKRTGTGEVS
jgi:hypothetical protein